MSATPSTPPSDVRRGGLTRAQWLDLAAAGIAIGLFLAIQFFLLLGPHPFDPAKYFSTAVRFPNVGADLWTLRIGLVAPVVVAVRLIGANEAALYAVPLASGVLLVTAVYGTMLALFRDRVLGIAAALVAALNTDFLLNSSFIFPDTAATATFSTGFLFLVLGGLTARASNPWVPRSAVLCAGFFFGWTYLIRDFSPILTPTVVAAALVLRYPWRRFGLMAAAAVTTGMLEFVYGALQYGKPFIHLEKLFAHRDAAFTPSRAITIENVQRETQNPAGALLVLPRIILSWSSGWFLLLLAPIFVAALILLRDRAEFKSCTPEKVWRNDPIGRWHEFRSWLATDEATPYNRIVTDRITAREAGPVFLSALAGDRIWGGSFKPWPVSGERIEPTEALDTSLILLNRRRLSLLPDSAAKLNALMSEWTPVFVSGDGALVLLAHRPPDAGNAALPTPWWERTIERSKPSWGCGINPFANRPDVAPTR